MTRLSEIGNDALRSLTGLFIVFVYAVIGFGSGAVASALVLGLPVTLLAQEPGPSTSIGEGLEWLVIGFVGGAITSVIALIMGIKQTKEKGLYEGRQLVLKAFGVLASVWLGLIVLGLLLQVLWFLLDRY